METLKVYPGIEEGTVEYYYKKFRHHIMVKDTRRPFTIFVCMHRDPPEDGLSSLTCLQEYISLNPGAEPQKYVSTLGWPDALFWEEGSVFGVPKNYIDLMGESCAGCIELPKYRRFLLFPLYRLVTLEYIYIASPVDLNNSSANQILAGLESNLQ